MRTAVEMVFLSSALKWCVQLEILEIDSFLKAEGNVDLPQRPAFPQVCRSSP